jgi:hypothetical protein
MGLLVDLHVRIGNSVMFDTALLSLVISYPSRALKVSRSRAARHNNRAKLRPYDPSHLSCFELDEYGRAVVIHAIVQAAVQKDQHELA